MYRNRGFKSEDTLYIIRSKMLIPAIIFVGHYSPGLQPIM